MKSRFPKRSFARQLPPAVLSECKRATLDSIGVALAAIDHPKGRAGIEYGRIMGGGTDQATIMGTGDRVSLFSATFVNAELNNNLDMCVVAPPGHVTPDANDRIQPSRRQA